MDTTYVFTDENVCSGVATIFVDTNSGQNEIIIVAGSNDTLTPEEVRQAEGLIREAKLMSLGLEGNHDAFIEALQIAKKHKVTTLTNAAPASANLNSRCVVY